MKDRLRDAIADLDIVNVELGTVCKKLIAHAHYGEVEHARRKISSNRHRLDKALFNLRSILEKEQKETDFLLAGFPDAAPGEVDKEDKRKLLED